MAKDYVPIFIPRVWEYVSATCDPALEPLAKVLHAALPHADPRFSKRI